MPAHLFSALWICVFEQKVDHVSPPSKFQKCLDLFWMDFKNSKLLQPFLSYKKDIRRETSLWQNTLPKWTILATQVKWRMGQHDIDSNIIYRVKYFHSVDACRAISVTSQTMKGSGLSQNVPWSENHHVEGEDSMKWQNRWLLLDSNKLKTKNSTHFLPNQSCLSNDNPLNIPQL